MKNTLYNHGHCHIGTKPRDSEEMHLRFVNYVWDIEIPWLWNAVWIFRIYWFFNWFCSYGVKFFDWQRKAFLQNGHMAESQTLGPADPVMVTPRLIALREALGLNKADFADAIGIDRSSYSKIEKAEKPILPPLEERIWSLYGVDMNYIYLARVDTLPSHLSSKITRNLTTLN